MQNHSVTVVIPAYNRADRLRHALRSVYEQSRPASEIIVVDDGSEDGTGTMMQREFSEARYVKQANLGVSAARNHGIRLADNDWIAFLDSDDAWHPEKLERQIDALQRHPQYRLCHSDETWIRHGKRVNPLDKHRKHGGDIFAFCLPRCVISPSSVLIHRSVFDDVGLFDEALPACEDYDLWLRICARMPVLFIDEPLITKHGGHKDQLSHKYWGMDRFRIRALQNLLQSGILNSKQRHLTRAMLIEKCTIYMNGARKRNKTDEWQRYSQIIDHLRQDQADALAAYLGSTRQRP